MFIEEITATEACNYSPHNHAYVNPYNGCSMGCPFCFWLSQEGWEHRIQIKNNIPQILEKELEQWPRNNFIYLGSVCDPFNELEAQYGLTKACLEKIRQYQIPLLITTSAVNPVIMDCMELIKSMKQRVIVVVELSRIPYIEAMNQGEAHIGIVHANELKKMGIETWATLSPILPRITDLKRVLQELDAGIPVYVDSLNCTENTIQGKQTLEWIKRDYPEYLSEYTDIIAFGNGSYFHDLLKQYEEDPRVKQFPFQLEK